MNKATLKNLIALMIDNNIEHIIRQLSDTDYSVSVRSSGISVNVVENVVTTLGITCDIKQADFR